MKKKWILILLGLASIAALFSGCVFPWADKSPTSSPQEDGIDWIGPRDEFAGDTQSGGGIAIPGMDVMKFKAGEKKQKVNLYNPAENHCYFRISLLLEDGTLLYQSNLLAPGKGLYEINLLEALPEGVYHGSVLQYECFGMDEENTPLNGAELLFTIQCLP